MKPLAAVFLKDGYLTFFGSACLVFGGIGFIYLSVEYFPLVWMRIAGAVVGLTVAAVGGYSVKGKGLGIPPPFTNDPLGWRKAKETYKNEDEAGRVPPKGWLARLVDWLKS